MSGSEKVRRDDPMDRSWVVFSRKQLTLDEIRAIKPGQVPPFKKFKPHDDLLRTREQADFLAKKLRLTGYDAVVRKQDAE